MKAALAILMVATVLAMGRAITGNVRLEWDYPSNHLSTSLTFYIFGSTNMSIPMTNWPMLTNVVGTNTSVRFTVAPIGEWYFVATASNFWMSDFSNVVDAPPLPTNAVLRIFKIP